MPTEKPLVSGIVIFLNAGRFIEEAIDSVFAQTFKDWELLLVDDGSTDCSTEIARRYAEEHPGKVRYYHHPDHQNRGMSASRNLGISRARGDYIAFLDSDDIWLPSKLEQQVRILHSEPRAAMVYGRTVIWHSWTGDPVDKSRDHTLDLGVRPDTLIEPPDLFLLLLGNKVQSPTTCNAIIRRETFEKIGTFEESFRSMYEDQVFFAKVFLKAPVYVAGEIWARYRQRPDSCSSAPGGKADYHARRLPFLNWLEGYLVREKIRRDSPVRQALRKELWPCRYPGLYRMTVLPRSAVRKSRGLLKHIPKL
jgi:glycosyltransferase involved in cell wall biosynthesis